MRSTRLFYRIFKTLRFDEKVFCSSFLQALLNPESFRPYLRPETRHPFTLRLEGDNYKIIETASLSDPELPDFNNALFPRALHFTRPQSTSYCDPRAGYKPPFFGHNTERGRLIVGFSFDDKDCLFRRIMMYDGGTINRPYDHPSVQSAQNYLRRMLENGIFHTSLESLKGAGLREHCGIHNEVSAGFKWNLDGSSHITIFSNNLESRLLAKLIAVVWGKMLKEKYPHIREIAVPISIYPDFEYYSPEDQIKDIHAARNEKNLDYLFSAISIAIMKDCEINKKTNFGSLCLLKKNIN